MEMIPRVGVKFDRFYYEGSLDSRTVTPVFLSPGVSLNSLITLYTKPVIEREA